MPVSRNLCPFVAVSAALQWSALVPTNVCKLSVIFPSLYYTYRFPVSGCWWCLLVTSCLQWSLVVSVDLGWSPLACACLQWTDQADQSSLQLSLLVSSISYCCSVVFAGL